MPSVLFPLCLSLQHPALPLLRKTPPTKDISNQRHLQPKTSPTKDISDQRPSNQRHFQPKRGRMEIFGSEWRPSLTVLVPPLPLLAAPCPSPPTKDTSNKREGGWKSASCGLPRRQKLLRAHMQVVEVTSLKN